MRFRFPRWSTLAWLVTCTPALALTWWGCSAAGDHGSDANEGNRLDPQGGTGGTEAGSGSSSSGPLFNPTSNGGGNGGPEPDAACAATEAEAELLPLDMLVVLDRSGSMAGSNWTGAKTALKTFINDPASKGINVGILYFPIGSPPDGISCTHSHYQTPAVSIGELPDNAPALIASIDGEQPQGGDTPAYGALKGALFTATAYQDQHPDHKVIVVFASDGEPNGCPTSPVNQNSIPVIADLTQSAFNYNGVQTYVIGISGANIFALNQIAAGGGTGQAFDVTGNIQQFADKMKEIREKALACEFSIPEAPEGQQLDYDMINVSYTASGANGPTKLGRADDNADCGNGPGWYYDNPTKPTKIILCPASCQAVKADAQAKMSVAFGCQTTPN